MEFNDAMQELAALAANATAETMKKYSSGGVTDEDDITGVLVGRLDAALQNQSTGGVTWSSSILRHRAGTAAEEKHVGADLIIHVSLNTPTQTYSKGVLVQSKRVEPNTNMSPEALKELKSQCKKMFKHSSAAFVFDYATRGMRTAPATKIVGTTNRELYAECDWTAYRFFLELFRCPVGDPFLTGARVKDLPVPHRIVIVGSGQLSKSTSKTTRDPLERQ